MIAASRMLLPVMSTKFVSTVEVSPRIPAPTAAPTASTGTVDSCSYSTSWSSGLDTVEPLFLRSLGWFVVVGAGSPGWGSPVVVLGRVGPVLGAREVRVLLAKFLGDGVARHELGARLLGAGGGGVDALRHCEHSLVQAAVGGACRVLRDRRQRAGDGAQFVGGLLEQLFHLLRGRVFGAERVENGHF